MSKKHYIFSFLLFVYAIVLGHSAIPHGHFDDLFSSKQHDDAHKDSDHKHNYPFSHCPSFHASIEKPTLVKSHSLKNVIKKVSSNNIYFIPVSFKPPILHSFLLIKLNCYNQPPIKVCSTSIPSRAPPTSMS